MLASRFQTLLGITGSGKSATIAWTIEQAQRPTLVLAPNKSLAAQLAGEFREFFPNNRVEYFVSYYDYYQPEAYMPNSDTYIEKDSSINDEIDPGYAIRQLLELADPARRHRCCLGLDAHLRPWLARGVRGIDPRPSPPGKTTDQRSILKRLVEMHYERNRSESRAWQVPQCAATRSNFTPAYEELAVRIELFGDEIERITRFDALTGEIVGELDEVCLLSCLALCGR